MGKRTTCLTQLNYLCASKCGLFHFLAMNYVINILCLPNFLPMLPLYCHSPIFAYYFRVRVVFTCSLVIMLKGVIIHEKSWLLIFMILHFLSLSLLPIFRNSVCSPPPLDITQRLLCRHYIRSLISYGCVMAQLFSKLTHLFMHTHQVSTLGRLV